MIECHTKRHEYVTENSKEKKFHRSMSTGDPDVTARGKRL